MEINRAWAMPSKNTFSIKPIKEMLTRYQHLLTGDSVSIDPFANINRLAKHCNDLDPQYETEYCMDALDFLKSFDDNSVDLVFFDPPYSPRQISECYKGAGLMVGMKETQSARLYKKVRDELMKIIIEDAVVLSFGWNSAGMGKGRGFEIIEILLVCHGGAHNDTICIAEKRIK